MKSCGVYVIEHPETARVYVGSSIWIEDRWRQHRRSLRSGNHHNKFFLRTWEKYGAEAFQWRIVEECAAENLHERETYWITQYGASNPEHGFNSCPVGGTTRGIKYGAEYRAKIKAAKSSISDETRAKLREARRRRPPMSAETKGKISAANSVSRGPKPEETKAKISATLTGRKVDREIVERVAASLRGRQQPPELVRRRTAMLIGQKRSPEARERMRQAALLRYAKARAADPPQSV